MNTFISLQKVFGSKVWIFLNFAFLNLVTIPFLQSLYIKNLMITSGLIGFEQRVPHLPDFTDARADSREMFFGWQDLHSLITL